MRLLTYTQATEKRLGLLVEQDVYDIANTSTYFSLEQLPADMLHILELGKQTELRKLHDRILESRRQGEKLPIQCCGGLEELRLCAPLARPPKLICLGRNYSDHIEEQGATPPEQPLLFTKASSAITNPGDPIVIPTGSSKIDFEGEVALVIGKPLKNPAREEAEEAIFGYTCLNDVTDREAQFGDKQWFRSKSMDTFAPLGPWIVTSDEIGNPLDLRLTTKVNSEVMQSESTSKLIFAPVDILLYASRTMTLEPGDIISTGTPGGVGVFREPQVFLKKGDVVEITVDKIGTLSNPVESET